MEYKNVNAYIIRYTIIYTISKRIYIQLIDHTYKSLALNSTTTRYDNHCRDENIIFVTKELEKKFRHG